MKRSSFVSVAWSPVVEYQKHQDRPMKQKKQAASRSKALMSKCLHQILAMKDLLEFLGSKNKVYKLSGNILTIFRCVSRANHNV